MRPTASTSPPGTPLRCRTHAAPSASGGRGSGRRIRLKWAPVTSDDAALEPDLVPELLVADLATSLRFWVHLCGFAVRYERRHEGFAYLVHGTAHVMLEQVGMGRNWVTGPLETPLGRGINFQVGLSEVATVLERLASAGWPLFMSPEEKSYVTDRGVVQLTQFLVQDPDGYLLRLSAPRRPVA